jgi:hypothetical protein
LGDFKGALESLTARAGELEGLNQAIADAKTQLANRNRDYCWNYACRRRLRSRGHSVYY